MPTTEEFEREIERLKEENQKKQERIDEVEAKAERERQEKEQEKARADALQERQDPSLFLDYIRSAEDNLFATFFVELSTDDKSQGSVTSVDGKYYPRFLRPWADFEAIHAETFATLTTAFDGQAIFPPLTDVEGLGRDLSPDAADELDLRPFIRAAIEKPASVIASRYLEHIQDPEIAAIKLRSNAYGLQLNSTTVVEEEVSSTERPTKRRKQQMGIPDRWGFAFGHDGRKWHTLVGEYKAAHKLPARKIRKVMVPPPNEDFFVRAIQYKPTDDATSDSTPHSAPRGASRGPLRGRSGSASRSSSHSSSRSTPRGGSRSASATRAGLSAEPRVPGHVLVARVLCQAYHYMITSGLEYGYVASGDGLFFLRVPEDDPRTLYYFWAVFPVAQIRDQAARRAANIGARTPQQTALAYFATLSLLAVHTVARPISWIDARETDLRRWPTPYEEFALPLLPARLEPHEETHDEDEDGGAGGSGGGPSSGAGGGTGSGGGGGNGTSGGSTDAGPSRPAADQGALKRPRPPGDGRTAATTFVIEPPLLPYCTQACLLGLAEGKAFDDKCPNVALHRAGHTMTNSAQSPPRQPGSHPLTADDVCTLVVAQLGRYMEKDCECLDKYGFFGQYGVLFKITVTGYGYTFVGKAVQAVHRSLLEDEAAVYNALEPEQGYLIPVFLGLIDLERPIPLHSCARVPHMILLSYAGPNLCESKKLPADVDFEAETERTCAELEQAGLWNDDVRDANLAWNAEVGRVMQLDFDQAFVQVATPEEEEETEVEVVEEESRLPLATKRDWDMYQDGLENDAARKQREVMLTSGER